MNPVWAQRREEVVSDCLVSPDVFHQMVERLAKFVVPYQHVLETEAGQRNVHLYLQGLLSHLPGKNAEDIATFVEVERQVIQDFIGTVPWDHRPLVVAYLLGADNSIGPLVSRLRGAQQPVVRPRHAFAAPRSPLLARF
jgi:hypothetical protein